MEKLQDIDKVTNYSYPSIIVDGQGNLTKSLEMSQIIAERLADKRYIEYIELEKDKKTITVEQARNLRKKVSLKNASSVYRVFIIKDAGKMGSDAQNTLLKTLEELGEHMTIILAVGQANDLLPTILSRSRAIIVDNAPDSRVDKKQYLIDSAVYGHRHASTLSEADISEATSFLKYSIADRLNHYKDITDNKENITKLLSSLRVVSVSAMRDTQSHASKMAWSHKVTTINDLLEKADANASGKLLLLAASTLL